MSERELAVAAIKADQKRWADGLLDLLDDALVNSGENQERVLALVNGVGTYIAVLTTAVLNLYDHFGVQLEINKILFDATEDSQG